MGREENENIRRKKKMIKFYVERNVGAQFEDGDGTRRDTLKFRSEYISYTEYCACICEAHSDFSDSNVFLYNKRVRGIVIKIIMVKPETRVAIVSRTAKHTKIVCS